MHNVRVVPEVFVRRIAVATHFETRLDHLRGKIPSRSVGLRRHLRFLADEILRGAAGRQYREDQKRDTLGNFPSC